MIIAIRDWSHYNNVGIRSNFILLKIVLNVAIFFMSNLSKI